MRMLITGASGMLGQDLRAACEGAGIEPIAVPHSELDIADAGAVDTAVGEVRPDVVVNCAAWTNVDGAEEHEAQAVAINSAGAGNVARAAAHRGAWTIHISSDYVFDGRKSEPYVESDPVAPLSAYGRSKLHGELEVAGAAPDSHTIVRSSWLFGTGGRCFPKTILRLARERGQIDVVSDQIGCPTYTGHLARALVQLAGARRLGVLHVASAGECSWFEFASEIVTAAGLGCAVNAIDTTHFPTPAERPAYSVLRSERAGPALSDWRDGLREFMAALARVPA